MSEKKKSVIAIPHVSFEAAKKTILALYTYKKGGSAKELMGLAGLNQTNTSKALSVVRTLGFAKEEEHGIYYLTAMGRQYARLLGYQEDEKAIEIAKKAIMNSKEWEEVVAFLRTNIRNPREPLDLVQFVESRLDKQWTPSMRSKLAGMYKSVLIGGGLIDPNEKKIVPLIEFDDLDMVPQEDADVPSISTAEDRFQDKLQPIVFNVPNQFTLRIEPSRKVFINLRNQLVDGSPFAIWLDATMKLLDDYNDGGDGQ